MRSHHAKRRFFVAVIAGLSILTFVAIGWQYVADDHNNTKKHQVIERSNIRGMKKRDLVDLQKNKKETNDKKPVPSSRTASMKQVQEWKNSNSIGERMRAILSLRQMKTPEAIELLAWFLDDVDDAVVLEAIDALTTIAMNSDMKEEIFDMLALRARDEYFPFRSQAVVSAAMIGLDQRMLPIIAGLVKENNEVALDVASRAMNFIANETCIPLLETVLEKTDAPQILKNVVTTLVNINTPESLNVVASLLKGDGTDGQDLGAWALSRKNDPNLNAVLTSAIKDNALEDSAIQIIASSPAAADVFGAIFEEDALDVGQTNYLLGIISKSTQNGSKTTRNEMATTVSVLMNSSNDDIVAAAADAIGHIQASNDQSEVLEAALSSDNLMVREKALYAYAQYCTATTYKPLTKLFWDKDEKIRRTAFFFSSAFMNESDRPVLEKAADHKDKFIARQSKVLLNNLSVN